MRIDVLNRAVAQRKISRDPVLPPPTAATSLATLVTLSQEAKSAVQSQPVTNETEAAAKARELRALLGKVDFHRITPRQMAELGTGLFARDELSSDTTASFLGVERNLVNDMDPDQPIDMVAHFERMLSNVIEYDAKEPGLTYAVAYRLSVTHEFQNVMSFVESTREHITPR